MKPHLLVTLAALLGLASSPGLADPATGSVRIVEVRGAKLYTESFGHGPPIVFLHGGATFFDSSFAAQRDDFAADHTVIGIDQRGHGHSPDGPWTLSYQMMAEDTAAILEVLHLGPVDLVGHSDGGDIALILARDHPQLVRRVVVSGANLRSGLSAEEEEKRSHWSKEQWDEKLRAVAASLPARFSTEYARVSPDGAGHWMALLAKDYRIWSQRVVIEPADLGRIAAPVLVMAGDHDFTSAADNAEIFRGLPNGQLMIVPASTHGTFMQRSALVNFAIREFLDASATGAPAH